MKILRYFFSANVGGRFNRVLFRSRIALLGIAAALVAALLLFAPALQWARAATEVDRIVVAPGQAARTISLRDRLVVGLQARLKTEVAFVELVAAKVRAGQIPQRLVDETFFWARDRAASRRTTHRRRPIIFFEPAMKARAKRIQVEL